MRLATTISCSLLLVAAEPRAMVAQRAADSVVQTVQSFLEWYVPVALADHQGPAWMIALARKGEKWNFSSELRRALGSDSAAQARAHGQIVGLDFDPFLNSQDPSERYQAVSAGRRGQAFLVEIYGLSAGSRDEAPAAVAQLVYRNHSWVFVNFRYPKERTDLLSVLKRLHH